MMLTLIRGQIISPPREMLWGKKLKNFDPMKERVKSRESSTYQSKAARIHHLQGFSSTYMLHTLVFEPR